MKRLALLVVVLVTLSLLPTGGLCGTVHLDSEDVFFGYAGLGVLGSKPEYGVRLINGTDTPVKVDAVFLRGPTSDEFQIVHDGCKGKVVYPGGSCEVKVSLDPKDLGDKEAYLIFKLSSGKALLCKLWGFADLPADFGGGGAATP